MEKTFTENGTIYVGEKPFTILMTRIIRGYKFMHGNKPPDKIVLPAIYEIDGVPITREVEVATEVH